MSGHVRDERSHRGFAGIVAAVAIASLVLQYIVSIDVNRERVGLALSTLAFFSYFTILTNLMMALVTCFAVYGTHTRPGRFFARARVRGGVLLYGVVTFGIYVLVLRHLWQPQGAHWWANAGLHYAMPVLYLAWWLWCVRHGELHWGDVAAWLLFPLAYLGWTLLRGAWLHEYPYPFVDVDQLGLPAVLGNSTGLLVVSVVLGIVIVALDRRWGNTRNAVT